MDFLFKNIIHQIIEAVSNKQTDFMRRDTDLTLQIENQCNIIEGVLGI